ncbi:C40 family peptidase [Candidatus Thiothrix sp. Deng01]|uniref:C40 family peptidase n=1 Tax=Candidatus Thiothrix phosphatis TaxID=3112415 RepID=A0ABU6D2S2_9GAMM|nr:C40 family peptidase [Candidatus Thiothrix sp. Deng01]MEB4593091.1 C40 family peptidase [Candidatus Thiothrix sp. Deng01]
MFRGIVQGFAVLMALSLVGCSSLNDETQKLAEVKVAQIPAKPKSVTLLDKVVWNAQKQQGKMYRWGGTSPVTGFDCSGLTQYAFRNGAQVMIPRTAAEQYAAAVKVSRTQAGKGDLVFFNTHGKRVSHVGIYLGKDRFVHAPRTGKAITTSNLKGYWENHLVGFGRIPGACRPSYS